MYKKNGPVDGPLISPIFFLLLPPVSFFWGS